MFLHSPSGFPGLLEAWNPLETAALQRKEKVKKKKVSVPAIVEFALTLSGP